MHTIEFLPNILILLVAAVVVVAIFKNLKLSPVLGYLVAGALIGPHGIDIIHSDKTSSIAEFGVVFLLFAIGLELTFERLMAMRAHVFGFGSAQVLLTTALIGSVVYYIGKDVNTAIIVGGALALSSTAIVLQVMAESGQQSSQVGRLSLANLLLQDFAVVPLLVLVPLLADESASLSVALGSAMLKAIAVMIGIFVIGRLVLRPLFRVIGALKSAELFMATTLLIVLGTAWITEHFGLSLALGAFIAGLLVAETEYQHQVEDDIVPFKGIFMGLFFMTVGMSIDLNLIGDKLWLIVLLTLLLIVGKALVIILLCRLFRFPFGSAIHAGLLLSQGGEFAFILFGLASEQGIINPELAQVLLLLVTVSMAITPLLSLIGKKLGVWVDRNKIINEKVAITEVTDLERHVVIAGFGQVGKMVSKMLTAERVNYIALDISSDRVSEGRKEGCPVYRGDASRLETLKSVGIERATAVILTVPNEVTLKKSLKTIREHYPELPVVIRAKNMKHSAILKDAGASIVVPEIYEVGLQLGGAVLKFIGVNEFEISRLKNRFRAGEYRRTKELTENWSGEERRKDSRDGTDRSRKRLGEEETSSLENASASTKE